MSDLAFSLSGEPFEIPAPAMGWRVRKLKPKGAPEIVYGTDGTPLTLPIDADMDDLRREVIHEGRYRLDLVDETNRTMANAPVGYVYVHPAERTADLARAMQVVHPGPADPVVEAMRLNSELAKTIIDRFPLMVESVSGLVRSVGDAGGPLRTLRGLLGEPAPLEIGEEDVDVDDDEEPRTTGWASFIEQAAPTVLAGLKAAITSGAIRIPGGLGALFDCRLAAAAGAAEAREARGQGAGPAPGHRDPAPARSGGRGPVVPGSSRVTAPAQRASRAAAGGTSTASQPPAPPVDLPPDLPTLDATTVAHLSAIRAGLTLEEQMLVQGLLTKFSPEELRAWLAELKTLSVRDGIAEIRAVLGTDASASSALMQVGEPS